MRFSCPCILISSFLHVASDYFWGHAQYVPMSTWIETTRDRPLRSPTAAPRPPPPERVRAPKPPSQVFSCQGCTCLSVTIRTGLDTHSTSTVLSCLSWLDAGGAIDPPRLPAKRLSGRKLPSIGCQSPLH